MAGASTTVTTIETTIEHLDFDPEIPCEERPCCDGTAQPAVWRLIATCWKCPRTDYELICDRCWKWINHFDGFVCAYCNADLGAPSECLKVVPLKDIA